MTYIKPENVSSPKASWQLKAVLYDGGEGNPAISLGTWNSDDSDDNYVIAMRWNGTNAKGKSLGNPQSTGHATWFILPSEIGLSTLRTLSEKFIAGDGSVHIENLQNAIRHFDNNFSVGLY